MSFQDKLKTSVSICLFALCFFLASFAHALDWKEKKSKHFVLKYTEPMTNRQAGHMLSAAEKYYSSINQKIGFVRYHNFWTWDERAQIVIYPSRESFIKDTNQPEWSQGSAVPHHEGLNARAIFSYYNSPNFREGILPHEIAHLIIKDFIGDLTHVPIWFNEGVAQIQESTKKQNAAKVVRNLKNKGGLIPLKQLHVLDIRFAKAPLLVLTFYAQSVSIVDYMINAYGSGRFAQLCRELKSGKTFEEALRVSYRTIFDSLDDLEKKWLSSIPNT